MPLVMRKTNTNRNTNTNTDTNTYTNTLPLKGEVKYATGDEDTMQ